MHSRVLADLGLSRKFVTELGFVRESELLVMVIFFLGRKEGSFLAARLGRGSPGLGVEHENMNVAVKVQIILVTSRYQFPSQDSGGDIFNTHPNFLEIGIPRGTNFLDSASLPTKFVS